VGQVHRASVPARHVRFGTTHHLDDPRASRRPEEDAMKSDIHPDYKVATVTCSCGNTFQTRATTERISVELCNQCHPFYTGKQKLVDVGGRVDRFKRRMEKAKK
jgi:large subunit ribosomal protein L31